VPNIKVKINDIAYWFPMNTIDNNQLGEENPDWETEKLEKRTGVFKRHIAANDETALDLSFKACKKLFAQQGYRNATAMGIDGIIFCTQSPDYIMPPNSCILHKLLGLGEKVFAFDYTLACSGFVYGLSIVKGMIESQQLKSVLLVTADTYSKYIHVRDRSIRSLFGDGAAVTWITASSEVDSIIDIESYTCGKHFDKFIVPAGGCRLPKSRQTAIEKSDSSGNLRTPENIFMDGMGVLSFVSSRIPPSIENFLKKNDLTKDDVDLFIFHQASQIALTSMTRLLNLPPNKVFKNIREIGNTVSASIPIALKQAVTSKMVEREGRILLCGFGVGLSWSSAIIRRF